MQIEEMVRFRRRGDLPGVEVRDAFCVYFFDQRHPSRHFNQLVAVTPVADARCLQ